MFYHYHTLHSSQASAPGILKLYKQNTKIKTDLLSKKWCVLSWFLWTLVFAQECLKRLYGAAYRRKMSNMISYCYKNLCYIERYIVDIELYVLLLVILPLLFCKQYLKNLGGFFFKMPSAELSFLAKTLLFLNEFFENLNFKPFIAYGTLQFKSIIF